MRLEQTQVERTVALLARRDSSARLVGVRGEANWTGDAEVTIEDQRWCLAPCRTRLEISARLVSAGDKRLVLVTPLDDAELGQDVLARLARQRLYEVNPWELVKARFSAQSVDPRVMKPWLADLLLSSAERMPAVPGGWLDADTAWQIAFSQALGLDYASPDAVALLHWSMDPTNASRIDLVPDEAREGLIERLGITLGPAAIPLTEALRSGHANELLPLGLVCEVLYPPGSTRKVSGLDPVVARLESSLGNHTLTRHEGLAWQKAACTVLGRLSEEQAQDALRQASIWLDTLKVPDKMRGASTLLDSGYDVRLATFGETLKVALEREADVKDLEQKLANIESHRSAKLDGAAIDRLRMALRALRWLHSNHALPETLAETVRWHSKDGAFVDWARRSLLGAESPPQLADGIAALRGALQQRRDAFNECFATQLATWTRAPVSIEVLPVEQFLDQVVCQLPNKRRVLVIVLDGMDGSAFAELGEDLQRRGWVQHASKDANVHSDGMLAVLPTVTEFSRSALLTGQLGPGDQRHEKKGFSGHSGIAGRSQSAPVLFHKGELSDDGVGGLSEAVRKAVADNKRGVVGVVINAIDDHLAKSEQLRLHWNVEAFRLLGPLLDAAELASRTVIITADHGHVLESAGEQLSGGDAERWRDTEAPTERGEIQITGPRLQRGAKLDRAVLLWTERARYCRAKAGYHGGATLQEAVVPLAVLTRDVDEMEGWHALSPQTPEWWYSTADVVAPARSVELGEDLNRIPAKASSGTSAPAKAQGQIGLFDDDQSADEASAGSNSTTGSSAIDGDTPEGISKPSSAWIQQLLATDVYAAQRRAVGRRAPSDELLEAVLAALDTRGGRMPETLLARTLEVPMFRVRGVLTAVRSVLHLDGVAVISVDEGASAEDRIVRLDRELLIRQFES